MRQDVLPWILIHNLWIFIYNYEYIEELLARFLGITCFLFHGLFFISSFWSKKYKAFIEFDKTTDISRTTHVLVTLKRK